MMSASKPGGGGDSSAVPAVPASASSSSDSAAIVPWDSSSFKVSPTAASVNKYIQSLQTDPAVANSIVRAILQQTSNIGVSASSNVAQLSQWLNAILYGSADSAALHSALESAVGASAGSVCGHSFRPGECAYQCSTCQTDPTCIQCVTCFRLSDHSAHERSVRMVYGSRGSCDCGDKDSWKEGSGTCSKHRPRQGAEDIEPLQEVLNAKILDAAQLKVSEALVGAVVSVVATALDEGIQPQLRPVIWFPDVCFESNNPTPTHLALLLNDDTHSFDQVISQLRVAVNLQPAGANAVANIVHGLGKARMYAGSAGDCARVATKMAEIGLGMEIHSFGEGVLCIREIQLVVMLQWLHKIAQVCRFFRDAQTQALLRPRPTPASDNSAKSEKSTPVVIPTRLPNQPAGTATAAAAASSQESKASEEPDGEAEEDQEDAEDEEYEEGEDQEAEQEEEAENDDDDEEHELNEEEAAALEAEAEAYANEILGDDDDEDAEEELMEDESVDLESAPDAGGQVSQGELSSLLNQLTRDMQTNTDLANATPAQLIERLMAMQRSIQEANRRREEAEKKPAAPVSADIQTIETKAKQMIEDDRQMKIPTAAAALLASQTSTNLIIDSLILYPSYLPDSVFKYFSALTFVWFANASFKQQYALEFSRNLTALLATSEKFSGELDHSALDFAVQLFTIPSIALALTKDNDLFTYLSHCLYVELDKCRKNKQQATVPYVDCSAFRTSILQYILFLQYVCRCKQVPRYLFHQQPAATLTYYCRALLLLESMDPVVRRQHVHVERESVTWKTAFTEEIRANSVSQLLLDSLQSALLAPSLSNQQLSTIVRAILDVCEQILQKLHNWNEIQLQLSSGSTASVEVVNGVPLLALTMDVVSVHLPLTKFVSEILSIIHRTTNVRLGGASGWNPRISKPCPTSDEKRTRTSNQLANVPFSAVSSNDSASSSSSAAASSSSSSSGDSSSTTLTVSYPLYMHVLDSSCRTFAFLAHVQSGLFVYNGESVLNIDFNYSRTDISNLFVRADVHAMQQAALFLTSETQSANDAAASIWINVLARRFYLSPYFHLSSDSASSFGSAAIPSVERLVNWFDNGKLFGVIDRFFETLIVVLTDRRRIGRASLAERVKQELIQRLMISNKTFSQLCRNLEGFEGDEEDGPQSEDAEDMKQTSAASSSSSSTSSEAPLRRADAVGETRLSLAELKDILASIANFQSALAHQANSSGVYELKSQFFNQFHLYDASYSTQQRQKAESNYINRMRESKTAATPSDAHVEGSIGIYPPRVSFAPLVDDAWERLLLSLLEPQLMEMVFHTLGRYIYASSKDAASDGQAIKASAETLLNKYLPLPAAGNIRGTHERILTHCIYLVSLAVEESQALLRLATDESSDSKRGKVAYERLRRFLNSLSTDFTPTTIKRKSTTNLLLVLAQLHSTAVFQSKGNVSDVKSGKIMTGWKLVLQQPLLLQTLNKLVELEQNTLKLQRRYHAVSTSASSSTVVEVSMAQFPSVLAEYGISAASTAATTSSVSAATSAAESDRAVRLSRAMKVRRRIVRDMRKKMIEFAEHNKLPKPKLPKLNFSTKKKPAAETNATVDVDADVNMSVSPAAAAASPIEEPEAECMLCRSSALLEPAGFVSFIQPSTMNALPVQTPPSLPFQQRIRCIEMDEAATSTSLSSATTAVERKVFPMSHRGLPLQIPGTEFVPGIRDTSVPVVVRSCMHALHYSCLDSYVASLWQRRNQGMQFEGMQSIHLDRGEFVCPLCKQLANCLLPIADTKKADDAGSDSSAAPTPLFQVSQFASPIANVDPSNSQLQTWLVQEQQHFQQASTAGSSATPPHPASNMYSTTDANAARQYGLVSSFADSVAKMSGRAHTDSMARIRFLMQTLIATIRSVETANRNSPFDVEIQCSKLKHNNRSDAIASAIFSSLSLASSVNSFDVDLLQTLIDDIAIFIYHPSNRDNLSHVRSVFPSLAHLFAQSTILPSGIATSVPVASAVTSGQHPEDTEWLPHLTDRDLLSEDPFELLIRCVISQGYDQSASETSTILHHCLALLWQLVIFQSATHFAFRQGRDLQHVFAMKYREQIQTTIQAAGFQKQAPEELQLATTEMNAYEAFVQQLRATHDKTAGASLLSASADYSLFVSLALPFLRNAWLLFRALHLLPAPQVNDETKNIWLTHHPLTAEFILLQQQLHLPNLQQVFADTSATSPMQSLLRTFVLVQPPSYRLTLPLLTAFQPPSFIDLPKSYDVLFQSLTDDETNKCLTCGKIPKEPAVCMVCGRMLCAQEACCRENQKGELTNHTARCTPCNGYYLLLREAAVVSVSGGLSFSAGSCYCDAEGELDLLLRRGRPLYLSQPRLEAIRAKFANSETTSTISRARNVRYMQELAVDGFL